MSKKEFARRVMKKFHCRRVMAYGIDNIWGLDHEFANEIQ